MHSHLPCHPPRLLACFALLAFALAAWPARALEQTLVLQQGWNAVFLELEPTNDAPEAVFAGQPVEMCAAWLPGKAKVASLTDPTAIPKKSPEWHIWQPASQPAAFLNNLRGIKARQALLIKATAACSVVLKGEPVFERRRWIAPSFNFTGFDVDPAAPPTFARFFDGSRAHADRRIYKLLADKWQPVAAQETVQRGVGYWVWTSEGSDFQGPLDVSLPLSGEGFLTLANGSAPASLEARSNGSMPVNVSVTANGGLPVNISSEGASAQGLRLTRPRHTISLQRALDAAPDSARTLLTIKGGGMSLLLPVRGAR